MFKETAVIFELFLEVPQAQAVAGLLLERAADERAQRYAGDLQRVLEGQENALFRALVDGELRDVLAVKNDPDRRLRCRSDCR